MITIVNHHCLTSTEKEFIEEIMDFQFTPNICFRDWENHMTVEVRDEVKVRKDRVPVSRKDIEDALKSAEKKYSAAKEQYERLRANISNLLKRSNEPGVREQMEKLHKQSNLVEAEMGHASNAVNRYKEMLRSGRTDSVYPEMTILGEFISAPSPKVFLYLGSYPYSESSRYIELIPTFIHEMFHAVYYFISNGKACVREVEEPLVEFSTGVFLTAISNTNDEFKSLRDHHRNNVRGKSYSIGEVACYGFGAFLMDNVDKLSTHKEEEWIETYSQKAWHVNPSDSIPSEIVSSLYPSYPKDESKVFKLFEILLFGKRSRRKTSKDAEIEPDWPKWGVTSTPSDAYELFPLLSGPKLISILEDIILILKRKGFETALSIDDDFEEGDVFRVAFSGSFLFYCSLKPFSPDPDFFVLREGVCIDGTTVYPLLPLRDNYGRRPQMAIGGVLRVLSTVFREVFTLVNDSNGYTLYGDNPNSEINSILCSKASARLHYDIVVHSTSEVLGKHRIMKQVPIIVIKHFCEQNKGITYTDLDRLFNRIKCKHLPSQLDVISPDYEVKAYYDGLIARGKPVKERYFPEPIILSSGDAFYVTNQWDSKAVSDFTAFKEIAERLGYEIRGY